MNDKKMAFTLTETLIALAIVGVIAALTLPMLAGGTDKKTNAAELARAVELTEGGILNIMSQVGHNRESAAEKLSEISVNDVFGDPEAVQAEPEDPENPEDPEEPEKQETYLTDGQNLYTQMKGLMGLTEISNTYLTKAKTYSGESISNSFSSNKTYKFNKRSSVIITEDINDSNAQTADADTVIARIFFDVNGEKGPNRLGKDIFQFGLTNGGHVVPAGSQAYNNNVLSETLPLYTETCAGSVTDGRSCSARVMSDGWAIKY